MVQLCVCSLELSAVATEEVEEELVLILADSGQEVAPRPNLNTAAAAEREQLLAKHYHIT